MAMLRIREIGASTWTALPNPKYNGGIKVGIQDLDSEAGGAGRDQSGVMHRDRVGVKRKVSCEWPPMKTSDMSKLLSLMTSQFFELEYPDTQTGQKKTGIFYVGDRNAEIYTMLSETNYLYNGLTANFVER